MAQDFEVISLKSYNTGTGLETSASDAGPFLLGGTATDDGEWNVGDPTGDAFPQTEFQGHYEADGTTFLVFVSDAGTPLSTTIIYSVGATTASSGYPTTLADLPDLTTTPLAVCFAAGTLIATPTGERTVETLEIGDLVKTQGGQAVPVKWIGRQTLSKFFTPHERLTPVRVKAGTLGDGVPHTDLLLTADHALIIEGLAINAGALVNGVTVVRDPIDSLPDRVTYYHVETEGHEVILANGTPAETYVDYVQRRAFDNYAEYVELYGEDRTIVEMPLPRISAARHVPESLRARLGESADAA
ncbi:MAG: Hint domain-containing protein [Xanthomonadales bacterium]|jgi:hypothetical protein|nr:Hint domain-containing protein [Xanthomonadales bacterium]